MLSYKNDNENKNKNGENFMSMKKVQNFKIHKQSQSILNELPESIPLETLSPSREKILN